jgi:hypothetical protein
MNLYDTQLPANWSKGLFEEKCMDLAPEHMDKIFDTLVTGVANLLNNAKSMDKPTAYVVRKVEGPFVVGCVVQFFENDDKTNPGNWNMTWTFNENDIPENASVIGIDNAQTHSYFRSVAGQKYGMIFESESSLVTLLIYAFEQLKKWLDENAKEDQEVSIEVEGLFQARVGVEGGEKVFAMEADGEIKNLIKDDAAIEK